MKSEIGIISKQKLQIINKAVRQKTNARQWINTDDVLKWFEGLQNKGKMTFINLDIVEFYPSISEKLFNEAIQFAANHTPIHNDDLALFMNARKSLLHTNGENWIKKTGLFDTTMGAYDGAECCELIGLLMLSKIEEKYPQLNFGLYRDDGLGAHRRIPGPQLEKIKKDIIKIFKDHDLSITIHTSLKQVNFLDITMDLDTNKYKPFCKPNSNPTYIHKESNHPPSITKRIPTIISNRLNKLSCTEEDFNDSKVKYENALKNSGFKETLTYKANNQNIEKNKKSCRKRKITWFNPPYAANMKTDLGRKFLQLINKHFKKDNPLSKIINRHTIKLSYSCTPNMRSVILTHNKKLTTKPDTLTAPPGCNCRKQPCPLNGNCLAECVVYEAKITNNDKPVKYYGSTTTTFKTRYRNHTASFRNNERKTDTALASYVWSNELNPEPNIKWSIVGQRKPVTPGGTCGVCILEKVTILKNNGPDTLNVRSEIAKKCPHRNKNSLARC